MRIVAALGAALLLSACASHEMVVILPPSDGHIGGVVVHPNKGAEVVLDKVYSADAPGDNHVTTATAEGVDKEFHDAMAAFPKEPKPFTLLFERDTAELTPEMSAEFKKVEVYIFGLDQPSEIVITGHTDTSGLPDYNEKLSFRRASLIRDLFVQAEGQKKLDDRHITITIASRGASDAKITPEVNCKTNSEEPSCKAARNVEITVQ
jgi:outer membrane protein OmpA-like peptidoglycan-associated protein